MKRQIKLGSIQEGFYEFGPCNFISHKGNAIVYRDPNTPIFFKQFMKQIK